MSNSPDLKILSKVLPEKVRLGIYAVYGLASLALTGIGAYYSFDGPVPGWVGSSLATLGVLAVPLSALAGANVSKKPEPAAVFAPEVSAEGQEAFVVEAPADEATPDPFEGDAAGSFPVNPIDPSK